MIESQRELDLLKYLNKKGPKSFTEIYKSQEIEFSKGTLSKYLKRLRKKGYIDTRYKKRTSSNEITLEGKIVLEEKEGKKNLQKMLRLYSLWEKKIKGYRDNFTQKFGVLPNSFLLDCIEYLLAFERFKFNSLVKDEGFLFYLAFFLARYDIQYARSAYYISTRPEVMQYSQPEFCKKFNLEQTRIEYFCLEWSKIVKAQVIYDEKDQFWFLSPTSLLYEILMEQIYLRARRGSLQEIVFDNFVFNVSEEAIFILKEAMKEMRLELDFAQTSQLTSFVTKMMEIFLSQKKGYRPVWTRLPSDSKSLMELSVKLETELEQIQPASPRKLEILRTLREISARMNNYQEAALWTEKYLEIEPQDLNMHTLLCADYYHLKNFEKFLEHAEKLRKQYPYEVLTRMLLLKYYVDQSLDLDKATDLVQELERTLEENPNLTGPLGRTIIYKAKILCLRDQWDYARQYAEQVWYAFENHDEEAYMLLVDIYRAQQDWERLEDFCFDAYKELEYSPPRMKWLFFAHLKRKSFQKAQYLFNRVKTYFPQYLHLLEECLKEQGINLEEIKQKRRPLPPLEAQKVEEKILNPEKVLDSIMRDAGIEIKNTIKTKADEYLTSDMIDTLAERIQSLLHDKVLEHIER